jgi:hypothetical protein
VAVTHAYWMSMVGIGCSDKFSGCRRSLSSLVQV